MPRVSKPNLAKPFKFLSEWRSLPLYEIISYFLMFASVPMLAYGVRPYTWEVITIIIFTIITMYSGFFAALIWNDISDADIDAIVHPDRPIPSRRISKKKFFVIALVFSALTLLFSMLVSTWFSVVVILAALFVAFHNKYLKKRVRIPAYSEIFTPNQWTVVAFLGYIAIWSRFPWSTEVIVHIPGVGSVFSDTFEVINMLILALFIHFADSAHDLPEGIHDAKGDSAYGVRTYTTSFGEKTAARISLIMLIVSWILGVVLFLRTDLTIIFLIPFLLAGAYTFVYSYSLHRKNSQKIKTFGILVGRKRFDFLLFSFDLIFIDMLIQIVFLSQ